MNKNEKFDKEMATIKKLRNSRVEKYHNRTEEFNRVSEVDLTMKSQWPGG